MIILKPQSGTSLIETIKEAMVNVLTETKGEKQ